ncbi:MAG: hypothetical protein PWP07_929 [Epulopiscium sp.]|jgi:hypothetical protein|nr:hypothetical protein [Defluviitaleaceae bacterium]MDK2787704.1 hypothetical protein [Candidatus Epulonipiscium sp.]
MEESPVSNLETGGDFMGTDIFVIALLVFTGIGTVYLVRKSQKVNNSENADKKN